MIQFLVRPEVKNLVPYTVQQKEKENMIILDGNESPYPLPYELREEMAQKFIKLELNRYPDASCYALRQKIADYLGKGVSPEQILLGNGSDEVLQFLVQTFVRPGDRVLALAPTFSMYKIFTELSGGVYVSLHLNSDGSLDLEQFWKAVKITYPRMVFFCSPNNPTGTRIPLETIGEIAERFEGILVVDEAYGEFCQGSMISMLDKYPNLAVTRTFSKAFGLAGVRLGYLVANRDFIREVSKVVPPYHLNSISQMVGETILENYSLIEKRVREIIKERERLRAVLKSYAGWQVFPSEANFLFLRGLEVPALAEEFERAAIKVRKFRSPLKDAIRITVGTPEENDQVIRVIKTFKERRRANGTEM
ncbi:histidinol-phosphate transaminase [Anoxybacter fermentans]|nr:histidinol-phosphate transaminase [Anoxybacter fermentans]